MKVGVFDIETYHDIFVFKMFTYEDKVKKDKFSVVTKNVTPKDFDYIDKAFENCDYIVGYNSKPFDLPVLSYLETALKRIPYVPSKYIYCEGQKIIGYDKNNNKQVKFPYIIKRWQKHHFDLFNNCLLSKSLKQWEMYEGLRIRELPYKPDEHLTDEMIAEIADYCEYDVEATAYLLFKYGYDKGLPAKATLMAYIKLHELLPEPCEAFDVNVATLGVKAVYGNVKNIPPKSLDPLTYIDFAKYDLPTELKMGIYAIAKGMTHESFTFEGITFGAGGAHYAKKGLHRNVFAPDVSSMYPSLIILLQLLKTKEANGRYEKIRERKAVTKKLKKTDESFAPEDDSLKLALNSLSGKFRERCAVKSAAYDPAVGLAMCLIGEMLITELALTASPDGRIEVNTDSVFVTGDENIEKVKAKCDEIYQRLGIVLEPDYIPMLYFRDVNNYIMYDADGDVTDGRGTAYKDAMQKRSNMAVYGELFRHLPKDKLELDWKRYDWKDFVVKYHRSAASKYAAIGGETMTQKNYYFIWTTRECPNSKAISTSKDLVDRQNGKIKARWGVAAQDLSEIEYAKDYIDYSQYQMDLDNELELWNRLDLCTTFLTKEESKKFTEIGRL